MSITAERKKELIEKYATKGGDTGSPEVQVAVLTERIANLTEHFKSHKKGQSFAPGLAQNGEPAPAAPRLREVPGRGALQNSHYEPGHSPLGNGRSAASGRDATPSTRAFNA